VSVLVPRLYRRASLPHQLQGGALVGYAVVFLVLLTYPNAGIGISQIFYVPIVLASLSGGPGTGAAAGVIASMLYEASLRANGLGDVSSRAGVHLLAYVAAGTIVGYFAARARAMLAESLSLLDQMLHVARHDIGAGRLGASGLQGAISRRVVEGQRFGLLVGEVASEARDTGDALRAACHAIELDRGQSAAVARVGPAQLAVLVTAESLGAVEQEGLDLEQLLARCGVRVTFGWAAGPTEGDDALSLCRAASERLYARRFSLGVEPAAA
jgi:hypothetical protein